ncbi:hypothetical protein F4780DRAFT_29121 [Xylariomycetidae sp. FL0641]|nr:hypothetical protein F4780DRAFT_29121 [Xylariomycetidae sp. FL0641]
MERKRKLPARAAARVEHASKKRTSTPPERSVTPAPPPPPPPPPAPAPVDLPPEEPQLPRSLQPGNPLPTVETPQPEDLPSREYQSVQESGVLAESLTRSRHKWIHEGIFEKYWTKPTKRKGVVKEEPNNPPKDSMTKIGQVSITVDPHVIDAIMYAVKEPKPVPTTSSTFRPVMQYGPPNGVMPPPPKPSDPKPPSAPAPAVAAAATAPSTKPSQPTSHTTQPSASQPLSPPITQNQAAPPPQPPASQPPTQPPPTAAVQPPVQAQAPSPPQSRPPLPPQPQSPAHPQPPPNHYTHQQQQQQQPGLQQSPPSVPTANRPLASPRGLDSVLAAPQPSPSPSAAPHQQRHVTTNGPGQQSLGPNRPLHPPSHPPAAAPAAGAAMPSAARPAAAAGAPGSVGKPGLPRLANGADPIIVTLAEKASENPELRDLMKRVAIGDSTPSELHHFQSIIDQITIDYEKKGGKQGPSADRLIVDGRTVKWFADESRDILDIVLRSNKDQSSRNLVAPPNSDPLVVAIVKEALDKPDTRGYIQRIAEGKTKFTDALELKSVIDKHHHILTREAKKAQQAAAAMAQPVATPANGTEVVSNGNPSRKSSIAGPPQPPPSPQTPASQQALRSKGPPPSVRPEIAAIVFEFVGGTGDRYLFPKYSILEYSPGGSQVIASFLIVRKGSKLEYGGDPTLDYYQPVSIRISSPSGKYLENLARVVAPQDEVRRYMDDVMENMSRAEYVLLAMRLPKAEKEDQVMEDRSDAPRADTSNPPQQLGVLWTSKSTSAAPTPGKSASKPAGEDEQYQSFIASVS